MTDLRWYDKNNADRRKLIVDKSKRYKDDWRSYRIASLLKLSLHRLEESIDRFEDTGNLDIDQMRDHMNFSDMAIAKAVEGNAWTGKSK